MKTIKLLGIFFAVLLMSCSSSKTDKSGSQASGLDTATLSSGSDFYQCPMHPEIVSGKEADCSKCGMALEKQIKQ